jgi:ubiquinone/menaquinone biosynthesis C-methylase UbiE
MKIQRENKQYYEIFQKNCTFPLSTKGMNIKCMNAEHMDFPDGTFDVIVSMNVFEHISDLPKVISEMFRVLKENGVIYISAHLFTSPTGGHQYSYKRSLLPLWNIPGWDHLRSFKYPAPVFLNKVRMHEYISLLGEKFQILQLVKFEDPDAEKLLTPEIRADLKSYSEEELRVKNLIIVAKKPLTGNIHAG